MACPKGNSKSTTARSLPSSVNLAARSTVALETPVAPKTWASRKMISAGFKVTLFPSISPSSTNLPYWARLLRVEGNMAEPTVSITTLAPSSTVMAITISEKSRPSSPKTSSAPNSRREFSFSGDEETARTRAPSAAAACTA